MGSTDDDNARRTLKSEIIRAGWPDSSSYTRGFNYSNKARASVVHEEFINQLCDLCLTGWIDKSTLIMLGPCAADNMPRAMNLVGMINSQEGGEDTLPPIPNFWQWPVLSKEPERKDETGAEIFGGV